MVKIRMMQLGRKKRPCYRIVVTDSRKKRDGKYIEKVGFYNPLNEANLFEINRERVLYWIQKGAQPSSIVSSLLKKSQLNASN